MSFKIASWRAPSSILEASGLDFAQSGSIFSRFSYDFGHVCRELAENLPSHTMPVSIANLLRPRDVRPRSSKGCGAAVVPPWGESIRRPPKVCEACEITSPIAFRYARPITARESERPSSLCRPRFLIPSLCLSPGGGGPPESRGKNPPSPSCWASWVDFLPFPSVLQK